MSIEKSKPTNLFDFLDFIREKPELYIGEKSLTALYFNINGFNLSCWVHNVEENIKPEWKGFHDFVASKLKYTESTSGYRNMILEKNKFDEIKSLNMFFELLDSYKENYR
nr:hypothetical protein [uncultured Flavobacterium sp.]